MARGPAVPGKSARSSVTRRVTRRMAGDRLSSRRARKSASASGPGSARSARKRRGTASSRSGGPPRTPGGVTVRDAGPGTRDPGLRPLGGPRGRAGLRGGGRDRLTRGGPLGGGSGQGGREGPGEGTAVRPAVIVLRQCAGPRQPLGRCPAGQLGDDPGERPGAPPRGDRRHTVQGCGRGRTARQRAAGPDVRRDDGPGDRGVGGRQPFRRGRFEPVAADLGPVVPRPCNSTLPSGRIRPRSPTAHSRPPPGSGPVTNRRAVPSGLPNRPEAGEGPPMWVSRAVPGDTGRRPESHTPTPVSARGVPIGASGCRPAAALVQGGGGDRALGHVDAQEPGVLLAPPPVGVRTFAADRQPARRAVGGPAPDVRPVRGPAQAGGGQLYGGHAEGAEQVLRGRYSGTGAADDGRAAGEDGSTSSTITSRPGKAGRNHRTSGPRPDRASVTRSRAARPAPYRRPRAHRWIGRRA